MTINWKNTRRAGIVCHGKQDVRGTEVEWYITKSPTGVSYQLHLGTVGKVPMITRPTIEYCKEYAEVYLT